MTRHKHPTIYSISDNNGTYLFTEPDAFKISDCGYILWPVVCEGRILYESGGEYISSAFGGDPTRAFDSEADAMLWLLGIDPPDTAEHPDTEPEPDAVEVLV